VTKSDTVPAVH